jgi:CHASE3 domain sensor protein
MPNTGIVSLLRRTYWTSVVAIATVAATVIVVAVVQRRSDRWTQHSREVVRISRQIALLALDRETGVRGFLLSGDSASLIPEIAARVPLRALLDSLVGSTADNPSQQRRARAFADAITRWDSTFVRPAIAQREQQGAGAVAQRFGVAGLAGKVLFDDVRTRYNEFELEEESLYRARSRTPSRLEVLEVVVTLLGLVLLGGVQASRRRCDVASARRRPRWWIGRPCSRNRLPSCRNRPRNSKSRRRSSRHKPMSSRKPSTSSGERTRT